MSFTLEQKNELSALIFSALRDYASGSAAGGAGGVVGSGSGPGIVNGGSAVIDKSGDESGTDGDDGAGVVAASKTNCSGVGTGGSVVAGPELNGMAKTGCEGVEHPPVVSGVAAGGVKAGGGPGKLGFPREVYDAHGDVVERGGGESVVGAGDVGVVASTGSESTGERSDSSKGNSVSDSDEFVSVGSGFSGAGGVAMPDGVQDSGKRFFKNYVKVPAVWNFKRFLAKKFRVVIHDSLLPELALVMHTAGTVPDAFIDGRRKIACAAAVGDAAVALWVVEEVVKMGGMVSSVQALKSRVLSNAAMSRLLVESGLAYHVKFAPGVDPRTSKAGADAFEAILSVVYRSGGLPQVAEFVHAAGMRLA